MSLEDEETKAGIMTTSSITEMAAELGVEEEEYRSLLRLFAEGATKETAEIDRALQTGSREEVARIAHSLKGAAVSLGLVELNAAATALEQRAREGGSLELVSLSRALEDRLYRFVQLLRDDSADR